MDFLGRVTMWSHSSRRQGSPSLPPSLFPGCLTALSRAGWRAFLWGGFLLQYFAALKVYLYKTEENASFPLARAGLSLMGAWSSRLHIVGRRGALESLGPAACWSRASCEAGPGPLQWRIFEGGDPKVFLVPVYYPSHDFLFTLGFCCAAVSCPTHAIL